MSFQAMAWAIKQPLQTYEKMALLMLANYADSHGKCWPSVGKLMDDCGMSRKQVQRCMTKLEGINLVRREGQMRSYGQTTNMYYLNLNLTIEKPSDTPCPQDAPPDLLDTHNL
jgi:hypothetical protein